MAKQGGLGDNFYVGGVDLSGFVTSLDEISGGLSGTQDVTTIKQSAHARLGLLRTGTMNVTSIMSVTTGADDSSLKNLVTTDAIGTYCRGTTLGNQAACINAKQIGYDPTRSATGELTLKTSLQSNGFGLEWGEQLTAGLRTDTTATAGTAVDDGASSSHGGQAYVHLTAFAGTSVTIAVQSATTSGGSYSNVTGLVTSALTSAPAFVRLATTATTTINEFVKVTTTGTFTNAVFSVVFVRNPVAVTF